MDPTPGRLHNGAAAAPFQMVAGRFLPTHDPPTHQCQVHLQPRAGAQESHQARVPPLQGPKSKVGFCVPVVGEGCSTRVSMYLATPFNILCRQLKECAALDPTTPGLCDGAAISQYKTCSVYLIVHITTTTITTTTNTHLCSNGTASKAGCSCAPPPALWQLSSFQSLTAAVTCSSAAPEKLGKGPGGDPGTGRTWREGWR
jgi:hypothetical protein